MKTTYSPLYRHFIKGLREQRKANGVTQDELAARLKAGQSFVSKVERGERRIDVAEFVVIAQAIGQDPEKLFGSLLQAFPATSTATRRPLKRQR